jgi:hypothetical protein
MANPNPNLENLKPFPTKGCEPLASKQIQVRLPQSVDAAIREAKGKGLTDWVRQTLIQAAIAEGLVKE